MLDCLVGELASAGLSLNAKKTKVMTTIPEIVADSYPLLVDAGGGMAEVVKRAGEHKYLGRMFSGDLKARGKCNLDHRMKCAWLKFHQHSATLQNRNIPIHLRLRLFEAVVTPSVLYSLTTTPMTVTQLNRLDAMQRKMLRRIVGWIRIDDESWHDTGHRMKYRLARALEQHPVQNWSMKRNSRRDGLKQQICNKSVPNLCWLSFQWMSGDVRRRGRPLQRWTD